MAEIIFYRKSFDDYLIHGKITPDDFRDDTKRLYEMGCKIAHIKRNFSSLDLDLLIEIANKFVPILNTYGNELLEVLECIKNNPDKVIINIPDDFLYTMRRPASPT